MEDLRQITDRLDTIIELLQTKKRPRKKAVPCSEFDEFWAIFPKKSSKKDALKVWNELKPDPELRAKIRNKVRLMSSSAAWLKDNGQWIPNPAKWLRHGCWDDVVTGKCLCCDNPATKWSSGKGLCEGCRENWYKVSSVGWGGFRADVIERTVEQARILRPRVKPKEMQEADYKQDVLQELAKKITRK